MKNLSKREVIVSTIVAILIIICVNAMFERVSLLEARMSSLEQRLEERQNAEQQLLDSLREIKVNQEELKKLEQDRIKREKEHAEAVQTAKTMVISDNIDLGKSNVALSATDMNKIIDNWDDHVKNGTAFKGKGEAFVEASKQTGLNPIYLFAIASLESGFGNSYIGQVKHNYYGINAVDSSPTESSSVMGDNTREGIINGAHWIKANFYDNGYTTLASMETGGYSSNTGKWSRDIVKIANQSVTYL